MRPDYVYTKNTIFFFFFISIKILGNPSGKKKAFFLTLAKVNNIVLMDKLTIT